jgi:hypothetical protein
VGIQVGRFLSARNASRTSRLCKRGCAIGGIEEQDGNED